MVIPTPTSMRVESSKSPCMGLVTANVTCNWRILLGGSGLNKLTRLEQAPRAKSKS